MTDILNISLAASQGEMKTGNLRQGSHFSAWGVIDEINWNILATLKYFKA